SGCDEGDFPLFPSDVLEELGGVSDGDPIPLVTGNNLPSPNRLTEGDSPAEPSNFSTSFHTPVWKEEPSAPPDFELRESGVSPGNMGVWSRRRLEVGEKFGPYEGTPNHAAPQNFHQFDSAALPPSNFVCTAPCLYCIFLKDVHNQYTKQANHMESSYHAYTNT
uniref:Uncharacterized protein n=1 Tax=Astyanax mexicanus TaxID=7994 RepID=A0A3B1K576_ASTMX